MHGKLLEARRQWYAAYLEGNVGQLDHFESDAFAVIGEAGLQGKLDQLGSIAEAVSADLWFARGSRAEDMLLKMTPLGEAVSFYGQCRIIGDDRVQSGFYFSELWHKEGAQWRVLFFHFSVDTTATKPRPAILSETL